MSKQQTLKLVVANVKIAGAVQAVKFTARRKAVTCMTKGQPKIKVKINTGAGSERASMAFEAESKNYPLVFMGKTPAQAFARAAREVWA